MVLGITGGSGSGKTTLLARVAARGGTVVDCDAVYHELLETDELLLQALEARFPDAFLRGALNRKKLGKLVFEDAIALADLNGITHTFVLRAVGERLERARSEGCVLAAIDAIALFESGLGAHCDVTVSVQAPLEARVRRLMAREGIDEAYARARIAAQKPDGAFANRSQWVIENDADSAAAFAIKCDGFLNEIMGGMPSE